MLDGEPLPVIEAVPVGGALRLRGPLRDRPRPSSSARRRCPDAVAARAAELAVATWDALGLQRLRPRRPDARRATGELHVLEANTIPGLTDTSLLPQAADAAGIAFDTLVERILALASRKT